ncbi:MAG: glycosyltransferase family 4 protein [Anaerolineae bacterium]
MEARKRQLRLRNGASDDGPIRVLEVVGNATVGGMEMYVRNMIHHLPPDQFEVTCVVPYESPFTEALRQSGCTVYVAAMEDDPRWRSIQLTLEVARLHNIEVMHAHMPKAHVLAGLAGNTLDIPVAVTLHSMNVTTHEYGIWRAVGSTMITVCQETYTQALAMGVPPERVHRIANGVDLERFRPGGDGAPFREANGIPLDAPLLGFVGRLEHEKGPDHFVRAAQIIHSERPDVHFALVGQGAMRAHLLRMIEDFHLGGVFHLPGVSRQPEGVYPALDILVQTSRTEGMPLVLLEGMACGVPTVAMIAGGVREVVENERTGLIAFQEDWESVAWRCIEMLAEPARRVAMGQAARERVERLFDLRTSVQRTADVLKTLARPEAARQYRAAQSA